MKTRISFYIFLIGLLSACGNMRNSPPTPFATKTSNNIVELIVTTKPPTSTHTPIVLPVTDCMFFSRTVDSLQLAVVYLGDNRSCSLSYVFQTEQEKIFTQLVYPKNYFLVDFSYINNEPIFRFTSNNSEILFSDYPTSMPLEEAAKSLRSRVGAGIGEFAPSDYTTLSQQEIQIGNKQILEWVTQSEAEIQKYYFSVSKSQVYVFATHLPKSEIETSITKELFTTIETIIASWTFTEISQ